MIAIQLGQIHEKQSCKATQRFLLNDIVILARRTLTTKVLLLPSFLVLLEELFVPDDGILAAQV